MKGLRTSFFNTNSFQFEQINKYIQTQTDSPMNSSPKFNIQKNIS